MFACIILGKKGFYSQNVLICGLIVGVVLQYTSVGVKNLRLRNESHILAILYYRKIPCIGVIEEFHNLIH